MPLKYGTQLGATGGDTRPEALERAKTMGCDGLEVGLPVAALGAGAVTLESVLEEAGQMRADFERAGLDFISLTPGILLRQSREPALVRATCAAAQALGVRDIRMFFSPHVRWGGPNSKLTDLTAEFDGSKDARFWMERDTADLEALLDLSDGDDVRYVFELHHGYSVNSASAAMRILDRFPASRVGVLMDPGNMVFEGNEGWRNSVQIMGEYLAYLHCKNAQYVRDKDRWTHKWAGLDDGIANYGEIVTALKDMGFAGYLSIEDLRSDRSAEERVGAGIAYLRRLEQSSARVMPV